MASYLKDPPCALSTPSTCRCSQWKQYNTVCRKTEIWMFGWVYLYKVFVGAPLPLRITYQFWIWPMASYLKDPPCALSTPSTCRCSQWKQYNTVCSKNINMNVRLGISLKVFKGGRQIYIQIQILPRCSPFRITYQFWICLGAPLSE